MVWPPVAAAACAAVLAAAALAVGRPAEPPPPPTAAGGLGREEAARLLDGLGFRDVQGLRRRDGAFRAVARRAGVEVTVTVDAASGRLLEPPRLDADEVRRRLADAGHADVRGLAEEAEEFRARIPAAAGDRVARVDARTGVVLSDSPRPDRRRRAAVADAGPSAPRGSR